MTAAHFSIVAAIGVAFASGLVGWRSMQLQRVQALVHTTMLDERVRLVGQIRAENARYTNACDNLAALPSRMVSADESTLRVMRPSSAEAQDPSSDEIRPPAKPTTERRQRYLEVIQTDPIVQERILELARARIATTYDLFFQQSGLTSEQIARCTDNMITRLAAMSDVTAAARAKGLAQEDTAIDELYHAAWKDYWAAQEAILGQTGVRQMQEYEKTSYVRELVRGAAGAATLAGIPFSPQQAEQVTSVLAQLSNAAVAGGSGVSKIDWHLFDAQAGTFLTGAQIRLLQTIEPSGPRGAGWRFTVEMNRAINEAKQLERSRLIRPANE
jgi:hypothetical protein